jgi:oligopeptide/dipeptide ABC transporter ATP-binding protein
MADAPGSAAAVAAARAPLLEVDGLTVQFPIRTGVLRRVTGAVSAVDGVSFTVDRSETLGLVGESGCGKSTTARAIAMLTPLTGGSVRLDGTMLNGLAAKDARNIRRKLQIVFQDPHSSLDARMTVAATLTEPLRIHGLARGREAREHTRALLSSVGLDDSALARYPHEFSGGQRQRIAIARALAVSPALLICDEPVSSLDVSVQAQIINLLVELQDRLQLALLFIAHDLAVVRHVARRIAVMYLGQIVELGTADEVCHEPLHPYTRSLISAVPTPDPRHERTRTRIVLRGDVPSPAHPPRGCRFHPRCPYVQDPCRTEAPALAAATAGRVVACHFWREIAAGERAAHAAVRR